MTNHSWLSMWLQNALTRTLLKYAILLVILGILGGFCYLLSFPWIGYPVVFVLTAISLQTIYENWHVCDPECGD